jgi:hypothetical protein
MRLRGAISADAKPRESITMQTLKALMAQADQELCAEISPIIASRILAGCWNRRARAGGLKRPQGELK